MLVGGTAVALYGYYRHTITIGGAISDKPDIDVWYHATYQNYFRLLNVIRDLGYDTSDFEGESDPDPGKSYFRLNFESFTLDLLPAVMANIKFTDADRRKETVEIQNIPICFMGYKDLIEDKNASARDKDLQDISHLRNLREGI